MGVSVDDPGSFLLGNSPSEAVTVPSNIVFAPGDITRSFTLTPPDDWRDIPDSAITVAVTPHEQYEVITPGTISVDVADNDVAPQVKMSFNAVEVMEGNDLILTITRVGEVKNPLEIPISAGQKDDLQATVVRIDAGQSQRQLTFTRPDDARRTAPVEYEAQLHAGPPEFWTVMGPDIANAVIVDDDPYMVGVEMLTPRVEEGQYIRYRFFHDGDTGRDFTINVRRSEEGSAVLDSATGDNTWTFNGGISESLASTLSEARDGNDGDATFTVEILPGQDYVINPSFSTGQAIVRDADPVPVLGFRNLVVAGNESDGTFDFWVDMVSLLPSLRTVTVDYAVMDDSTHDGADITEFSGTLTFAPGVTEALIQVPVLQDLIAEADETFTVQLTNPVYAALQETQPSLSAQGLIEDDEPTVSVASTDTVVDEGDDVVVTLTRTGGTTGELEVWLRVRRSD